MLMFVPPYSGEPFLWRPPTLRTRTVLRMLIHDTHDAIAICLQSREQLGPGFFDTAWASNPPKGLLEVVLRELRTLVQSSYTSGI
jgi:hypothetical protein